MAKMTKQRFNRIKSFFIKARIYSFAAVMIVFSIIGILMFLRPSYSQLEKRALASVEAPTLSTFLNGQFFESISTWYADTFPFRESMISANQKFESLFGISTQQIYGTIGSGDEIPDSYDPNETQADTQVASQPETAAETFEDGSIHVVPEAIGTTYITGSRAFSLYYFNKNSCNTYIQTMNSMAELLDGTTQIYDMLVPTAVGVCLDDDVQQSIGSSSQPDTFNYIYNALDSRIKTIDSYTALRNHNSEYIYFNTDHHWTSLGSYYAYREFCKAKGITPHELSQFEKREYPGFVGSYYAYSNQAQVLKDNPDTVTAYVPMGTNDLEYVDQSGTTYQWFVIFDTNSYNENAKYSCFIGGDQVYEKIHNPQITDGSSCAVVKESYGNAFVPYLVDHYETVHVIDYRYYKQGIATFCKENGIQDLIFLNNADAVGDDNNMAQIKNLAH